jgi:hypothetical protein
MRMLRIANPPLTLTLRQHYYEFQGMEFGMRYWDCL